MEYPFIFLTEIYLISKVDGYMEGGRSMDRYEALVIKTKIEEFLDEEKYRVKIDYSGPKGGSHYRVVIE